MFGYLAPDRQELRVWQDAYYRATYCGVCRSIGRQFGQIGRLTLTYDMAVLALMLDAATGDLPEESGFYCAAHPARKRFSYASGAISYAAALNILLARGKLADDSLDQSSRSAAALRRALSKAAGRAALRYPDANAAIDRRLAENAALEKEGCAELDRAAEPSARLTADCVLAYPDLPGPARKAWEWLGYNLGKWIYLMDAWQDRKKDAGAGAYNVINLGRIDKDQIKTVLEACLAQAQLALDLLEMPKNREICENILLAGCPKRMEQVLSEEGLGGKGSICCAGRFRKRFAGGSA